MQKDLICPKAVSCRWVITSLLVAPASRRPVVQEEDVREALEGQLQDAVTAQQLADWGASFSLASDHGAAVEARMTGMGLSTGAGGATRNRPLRASRYFAAIESDLQPLAEQLAMPTDVFAETVDTISPLNPSGIPASAPVGELAEPIAVAMHFVQHGYHGSIVSSSLSDATQAEQLLEAAKHVMQQQIAHHPTVRAKVREIVFAHATATTEPTEEGNAALSPFHVHGCVKRIRGRPARDLLSHDWAPQWLHMVAAEEAGLLTVRSSLAAATRLAFAATAYSSDCHTCCSRMCHRGSHACVQVTLAVPEQQYDEVLATPLKGLFTVGVSAAAQPALFAFRRAVIDQALSATLVPMAMADLRRELLAAAQRGVLDLIEDRFWVEVTMPPLRLKAPHDEVRPNAGLGVRCRRCRLVRVVLVLVLLWQDGSFCAGREPGRCGRPLRRRRVCQRPAHVRRLLRGCCWRPAGEHDTYGDDGQPRLPRRHAAAARVLRHHPFEPVGASVALGGRPEEGRC